MKPLQAYVMRLADDGCEIVYARSAAGAKGVFCRRHGCDFSDVEVEYHPELDEYGQRTGGGPTSVNLQDAGWSVGCFWCEHPVEDYTCWKCEDEHGIDAPAVTHGEHVYCNQQCLDAQLAYWQRIKERKEASRLALLFKLPFVVPCSPWVGGNAQCKCYDLDQENVCWHFKVPGGTLTEKTSEGNHCHNSYCGGCGGVWVARGDLDAFRAQQKANYEGWA